MRDRTERLQNKKAVTKKENSTRRTQSVNLSYSSKLTDVKLAGGCKSTDKRRYKAPVEHKLSSPIYHKEHFSYFDNHTNNFSEDLNECLLDTEDDFHTENEHLVFECNKDKKFEVDGVEAHGNNLKLCSRYCNFDSRLNHFPLLNDHLDKCAIVILTDILKDKTADFKMNSDNSKEVTQIVPSKVPKMRPSNSKSPGRLSIAKPTQGNESPSVRTTYVKPSDKDTFVDGSKPSPATKVSSLKDLSKGKPLNENTSTVKTESPVTKCASPDRNITPLKKGKEKTKSVKKKESPDCEETNSPKKKRGKSKKAADSPSLNNKELEQSFDAIDQQVTPSKDDKKPVKTPRGRKKTTESTSPSMDEVLTDKKVGKKAGSRSRNVSESPSPRRKPSPKKSPEKASPKSTKKIKSNAQNAETDAKNSVDDNENAENFGSDNVNSSKKVKKSSVKKQGKPDSPVKKNCVNETTDNVKDEKSPKRKPKTSPANSTAKKKVKDGPGDTPDQKNSQGRNKSASPKKKKNSSDNKAATAMSRKLDFDDEISKVIYQRSRLALPADFEYKYTSSFQTSGPVDLSNLISKINNAMKENNKELTELFGETEEPVEDCDDKTVSPESSVLSTSTDSDKTILDFDMQSNLSVQEDSNVNQVQDNNEADDNGDRTCDNTSEEAIETEKDAEKLESVNESKNEVSDGDVKSIVEDTPCESVVDIDKSTVKNDNPPTVENVLQVTTNTDKDESVEQIKLTETVSVFELYGLTLRRKSSPFSTDKIRTNESAEIKCERNKNDSFSQKEINMDVDHLNEESVKDNIVVLSDTETDTVDLKKNDTVIILSDEEDEGVDRTGYESLKESYEKKIRPKFTTVNNIVEPKPLEILSRIEKAEPKKESAFSCDELDMYLHVHKHDSDFSYVPPGSNNFENDVKTEKLSKADIKEFMTKATPDLHEEDGIVFVSFSCEHALKAHKALEKRLDWLTVPQLKKLAQLKHMKERQNDFGAKRITDVKSIDEQKLNFRGIPMRMMKYQKMLKQEMEDILLGRHKSLERSPLKPPGKTTDITKIKGWKNKFQNQEELQEATGINISESGKVHWKTEERLVKNLDPEEIRDIGLDLKKKRRKLVNYSNRKKSTIGLKLDDKDADPMDYEYEIDEFAITEHDVYNEDDDKPPPEKIPYKCKYLSQHKYGARKLFVKKMKLDTEDERILQKLGTQKMRLEEGNQCVLKAKKQAFMPVSLNKITHNMAVAAASAFDKKLLTKAKHMAKTEKSRKKKEAKDASNITMEADEMDPNFNEHYDDVEDIPYKDNDEFSEVQIKQEPVDDMPEEVLPKRGRSRTKSRRQSSTSKSPGSVPNNDNGDVGTEKVIKSEDRKGERAGSETCAEPGCRYGCICHLCKLSDSGEEREADHRPQCDKEYCRLGCICDSIDTTMSEKQHCKKPGCMLECKCPPKQPKPDIPRERDHGKRKKKGKMGRKKKQLIEKSELEISDKEENINEDGEWEPPNKRKKGTSYSKRFTNLPKRQTTYRLAKNLDAVSRKAMEVYATSEMYAEQKVRRRRSDQGWEEDWVDKKATPEPRLNEFTGVLEISDDEDSYPGDVTSCARLLPYSGPYKLQQKIVDHVNKKDVSRLNKRKGGPGRKQFDPKDVIDLDSDSENGTSRKDSGPSDLPSTSSENQKKPPQTLTEKMGLVNLIKMEKETVPKVDKLESCRWKTQMVCLKAKKKSEDKSQSSHAEIKLLEIMSNCNWEIDRTNMLSKISHIISKDSGADYPRSQSVNWGAYVLEFLPKADVPALIPPELKSKLPEHIFSIRIKVTKDQATASSTVPTGEPAAKDRHLTMEERKRHIMKWQKKLIDKIKFAERLRTLIINEEQNGVVTSKFSVSREGIEKALKKYKTQLWKAYTGSSNLTLQQLKQALQAAKTNSAAKSAEPETKIPGTRPNLLSSATKARIQSNQGVTVVGSKSSRSQSQSFINLSNLSSGVSTPFSTGTQTSFGNIVIHQAGVSGKSLQPSTGSSHTIDSASTNLVSTKSSSAHGSIVTATQAQPVNCKATNLMDKNSKPVENETNLAKPILLQPSLQTSGPGPAVGLSNTDSSKSQPVVMPGMFEDVVLMPLDKNMNPKNLPPGVKLAVLQTVSKVNETTTTGPVSLLAPGGNQPFKMKTVVLSSAAVIPAAPTNLMTTKPCTTQVNGQSIRVASPIMSPVVISSLANVRPQSPSVMHGSKMTVTSGASFIGTPITSTSMTNMFSQKNNISNFNSSVPSSAISNVTTVATSAICSPSIYPIQFANPIVTKPSTSEIHVMMPPRDMIGFPKVSSLPFKLFPTSTADGKSMQILLPVSLPIHSSIAETSSHSFVSSQGIASCSISTTSVNSAVKSTAVASASEHSTGAIKPAVIKQKKCRKKKFVDKEGVEQPSNAGQGMEKEIDVKKIFFDNYHPVKSSAKNDAKSEKTIKDEGKDSDSLPHSDANLEINSQATACVESSNGEKVDEIVENEDVKLSEQDSDIKDSILDIKIEDVKSINPEHMDDCSDVSEQKNYERNVKGESSDVHSEELGVEMMPHSDLSNGKRASPDLLDLIDMEQTMKQMDEMENEARIKNIHQINTSVDDAIHIPDSEESDVDIMTCDLQEMSASGKRKIRYNASDDDETQNKKFKLDESKTSRKSTVIPRRTVKTSREKSRRHQLRCLFETLEQVVFKYNKEMQGLRGTVPKHLILQEAYGLIQALKQKNEILEESLEDGRHCREVLELQLTRQSREFVDLGVPAPIIKNFLKSVQRTSFLENKRKVKKETSEHSDSEDDDCTLDFKPLTQSRFKINETYDSEAGTSGNNSSCGERDSTVTNTFICSKDLQTTIDGIDKPIIVSESLEETLTCDPLRNHHQAIAGDCLRDICSTQEKFANCEPQGSKDSPYSEMTPNPCDMDVDGSVDPQEDNIVVSDDDDDIQSTTGDAMLDYEDESVHSELSNENVDNTISNTELLPSEITNINE